YAPWHPGRCAAFVVGDTVVGHAGELHPRVVKTLQLPERTSAMEIDVDLLTAGLAADGGELPAVAGHISSFPIATQDVALVVDTAVPAADVERALRDGAGELLESVRLFDVFTGEQLGTGKKSLAYALRFRAADRTLTAEETTAAREGAVSLAAERTGAVLRGA
ncbi:MAG: phenylalanine--tRNA ligase subunit beta, partial [Streptomycetaceae bacterium]|nr:phenylalanine--tRNA ligase subunit beta [Streptomycetaceae bacterium]